MRIIGATDIWRLGAEVGSDVGDAVLAWYAEVVEAEWTRDSDVVRRYPRAEFSGGDHVLFDLGCGDYCAVVRVSYPKPLVLVEFVGVRRLASWPIQSSRAVRALR